MNKNSLLSQWPQRLSVLETVKPASGGQDRADFQAEGAVLGMEAGGRTGLNPGPLGRMWVGLITRGDALIGMTCDLEPGTQ